MRSSRISDATHLAMLKATGAVECQTPNGSLWALFDAAYQAFGDASAIEGTAPALTCRTTDVESLDLTKDDPITVGDKTFRLTRHEPDGTGESVLFLKL